VPNAFAGGKMKMKSTHLATQTQISLPLAKKKIPKNPNLTRRIKKCVILKT
jgi:hypothetical protein